MGQTLAPLEPMLEFDRTEHPIRRAILTCPIERSSGTIAVPDDPGLGHRDRSRSTGAVRGAM